MTNSEQETTGQVGPLTKLSLFIIFRLLPLVWLLGGMLIILFVFLEAIA